MSEVINKLIDDILELILGDMDCHHEVDHEEGGTHMSVEYNLKDEAKLRDKIEALLKSRVTEEWIEEKARELHDKAYEVYPSIRSTAYWKNFIRSLVEEIKK